MTRTGLLLATALSLCLGACGQSHSKPGDVDAARLAALESDGRTAGEADGEWLSVGRTYSEQRFSPLKAVDAKNVGKLGLAWSYQLDTDRGQEATPVVVDGVLYTSTAWSKVVAIDAATGTLKWEYDPKVQGAKAFNGCCDVVNRGVAVWKHKIFVGALDGRLIALNAADGKEIWSVQTTDPTKPYTITGAPRVMKGKVIIGNGGAEYGVRGYISAYDEANGKLLWRFYTTPNPNGQRDGAASDDVLASKANATWFDGQWKETGGGGTVWDGMAYDPVLDIAYFGVGNGSPHDRRLRSGGKGDNLFLSSILALKPDTGEYVWHYQTTPGESWDYTATQPIILADIKISGTSRKVLMQAPKNGFFYVLDRANGRLISAKPYAPVNWATHIDMASGRPVENPKARAESAEPFDQVPGPSGAHSWHPMAFNPMTGLVYIPAQVGWFAFVRDAQFKYRAGAQNIGYDIAKGIAAARAPGSVPAGVRPGNELVAWDPATQTARWRIPQPMAPTAGVLTTAGRLLFQGTDAGELIAYDAANGQKLWATPTGNGIIAAPMTYAVGGVQYVAVMVGPGGGAQLGGLGRRPRMPGRLLVYKLDGSAKLAKLEAPTPYPPLNLQGITSTGNPVKGLARYNENCYICHGINASVSFLADLKRSPAIVSADDFKYVVIDGAKADQGMASFARFLTPQDAEDVRAYLLQEARKAPTPSTGPSGKGSTNPPRH